MLEKIVIKNFKCFEEVEIDLGNPVVFIGPNNSGKSSAVQALSLWNLGIQTWLSKHSGNPKLDAKERLGVAINRKDVFNLPVPELKFLWKDTKVRKSKGSKGSQRTDKIPIEISVYGKNEESQWEASLRFDYENTEALYCKPLEINKLLNFDRLNKSLSVSYLPAMSGLQDKEFVKQNDEIDYLIGQGQTAQVLRNLCLELFLSNKDRWRKTVERLHKMFNVQLQDPYSVERAGLFQEYRDEYGNTFDISSSGRGMLQTLLLMVYLENHPNAVVLLDEPDAHLEIIRQREIFNTVSEIAEETGSQIVIASHSEVMLDEAYERGVVVAFLGNKPFRLNDRGSQLRKALKDIPYTDYYLAKQKKWILYLEGSTDLAILQSFARKLNHPLKDVFDKVFVHYVGSNAPSEASKHFFGLQAAQNNLLGFALFDKIEESKLKSDNHLKMYSLSKREIENYFAREEVILNWTKSNYHNQVDLMRKTIQELETARKRLKEPGLFGDNVKSSTESLPLIFDDFFDHLKISNSFKKSDFHELVEHIAPQDIDSEITKVLDDILKIYQEAEKL